MKYMSRIAVLFVATAPHLAPTMHAEEPGFTTKVPFEFSVGAVMLPAGDYLVTCDGKLLHVENRQDHRGTYIVVNGTDPSPDRKGHHIKAIIVFRFRERWIAFGSALLRM